MGPRYKPCNLQQGAFVAINFDEQILPGTFEYALHHLMERKVDLTAFDDHYQNQQRGACAYPPKVLLKIVLFAYSKGILGSRRIEVACRRNIQFMALSGEAKPDHATIAAFVSRSSSAIQSVFREVLLVCDQMGLIGKEMFAIDGVKLPSNASKEWSGYHDELRAKSKKLDRAVKRMLKAHRAEDANEVDADLLARAAQQMKKLEEQSAKIKEFLEASEPKLGPKGTERKSNVTDNDSAKMKTGHGTIQGYTAVAVTDDRHQVIVEAQAHGAPQEQELLCPLLESTIETFQELGLSDNILRTTKLTADSGFHSEANLEWLSRQGNDAYIADNRFRKRDPRFIDADKYKEPKARPNRFTPEDFDYDPEQLTCTCPAGERLHRNGIHIKIDGRPAIKFNAPKRACEGCGLRARCLRNADQKTPRQVVFIDHGETSNKTRPHTARMKEKIDSARGRAIYSKRLGTVEPPFGNIRHHKGMNRFNYRGRERVDGQWKLYALVHNIEKIAHYGKLDG